MIIMIDNYDSFTYNLVQYLGELGADVEVHRNDQITVEEIAQRSSDQPICAWICEGFSCQPPMYDLAAVLAALQAVRK